MKKLVLFISIILVLFCYTYNIVGAYPIKKQDEIIDLTIPNVVDRHQTFLELHWYPEKYNGKKVKAKGNWYYTKNKQSVLNLNYDGDVPESFGIEFNTDKKLPKEQEIITIIGEFSNNKLINCDIEEYK